MEIAVDSNKTKTCKNPRKTFHRIESIFSEFDLIDLSPESIYILKK